MSAKVVIHSWAPLEFWQRTWAYSRSSSYEPKRSIINHSNTAFDAYLLDIAVIFGGKFDPYPGRIQDFKALSVPAFGSCPPILRLSKMAISFGLADVSAKATPQRFSKNLQHLSTLQSQLKRPWPLSYCVLNLAAEGQDSISTQMACRIFSGRWPQAAIIRYNLELKDLLFGALFSTAQIA